jgi:hypothetical protein
MRLLGHRRPIRSSWGTRKVAGAAAAAARDIRSRRQRGAAAVAASGCGIHCMSSWRATAHQQWGPAQGMLLRRHMGGLTTAAAAAALGTTIIRLMGLRDHARSTEMLAAAAAAAAGMGMNGLRRRTRLRMPGMGRTTWGALRKAGRGTAACRSLCGSSSGRCGSSRWQRKWQRWQRL